ADGDMVNGGALEFVQRMPGRDQHLLRRTAAVRTGPAEIVGFDHRDRHSSAPDGTGNANAGVAAAKDHDVECLDAHQIYLVYWRLQAIRTQGRTIAAA